jgi:hypothetical protein
MTNLQADVCTRAQQIALRELKTIWRDTGKPEREFSTTSHRKAIHEWLANNPRIVERAQADVAAWRKNGRENTARKNGSLNPPT